MNARTRVNRGTPVYGEQLPEFREAVAIAGSLSRRKLLSEGWLTLLRAVPWAAGAGLIPAAIRLLGFPFISPLYGIIPVVIVPAAAGVIRFLQRKTDTRLMLEIDADLSLRQGLVTLLELGGNGGRENPYFPVICRETAGKLRSADAKSRYPLERGKPFVRAMVLLLLFLGAGTVSLLTADPRTRLTAIPGAILSEAGKRLAAREEESGNLSVLGEELERLGEEMEGGRIDVLQAREKIEELSEEVSRQIKDLKRNDLSSMLEEKRITPDQAEMLSRMLDEELTPDEVRELVLELTSEGETGLRDREAMQKSFEDFMDNPQEGSQSLLAEDLMDRLAREFEGTVIRTALRHTRGRRIDAAVRLGIGRNTITRKIQELRLEDDEAA